MIGITWEWVLGIVFGLGVLYASFRLSRDLVKQYGWREVARDLGGLLFTGTGAFVALAYIIGMGFLVNKVTSSGWVAVLLWFLLMLLPTIVYASVKQYGWREVARDLRGLLFTGTGAFVALAYMIGMGFLVNKLTSSGWGAVLLWFLLMILPTIGYAVVTTKIIIPKRKKKGKGSNTGKTNES